MSSYATCPSTLTKMYEDEIRAYALDANPTIAKVGRMGESLSHGHLPIVLG